MNRKLNAFCFFKNEKPLRQAEAFLLIRIGFN